MRELIKSVNVLVDEELDRASVEHGEKLNSPHEAYSVILEELIEASNERKYFSIAMNDFWDAVMHDKCADLVLEDMYRYAIRMASETIQCAAMIKKAQRGYAKEY